MSVDAFGPAAQRYAPALNGVDALVADSTAPAEALAACARRRRSGVPFYSGVLLDDPRATVAYEFAAQLPAMGGDEDGIRRLFDALAGQGLTINGTPQAAFGVVPPAAHVVLFDVAMMGDGLIVRSWSEAERLASFFARRRELVARVPDFDPEVPAVRAGRGDAIVVWAGNLPARHTVLYAYALKDFFMPVVIACHGEPEIRFPNVAYAPPDAATLARAAVVLDSSIGGPGTALALARNGVPLAVTSCSGAAEYLAGVSPFEPWSWRAIQAAAQRAATLGAPRPYGALPSTAAAAEALSADRAALPRDGPLVSVVVPTYNRRAFLPRALDSLAASHYADLEVIVVNDGGEDVGDIVARYGNARLIELERNGGITKATNAGLREARGEFVTLLSDDDLFYPDAIARWVRALSYPGRRVVNGNTVMRFDRRRDGRTETTGYRLIWKENVDHRDSLFTPFTPLSCTMIARSVLDEVGYYDETSSVMDMEYLMRLSRRYDYVHVDQPCVEVEYDSDKGQGKAIGFMDRARALQEMYARYPSTSADVARGRAEKARWHEEREGRGNYFEPEMVLAQPEIQA